MTSEEQKRAATEEVHSFDELAKGLAKGTISRGRALKLVGSAILGGGFLTLVPGVAEARTPKCPSGGGTGCFVQCTHTSRPCTCIRTTEGTKTCVWECCSGRGCSSSSSCRSNEVCVKTACCGGVSGTCTRLCTSSQPNYCTSGATTTQPSTSTTTPTGSNAWGTTNNGS